MKATYWMLAGLGMLTAVAIFILATPGATAWHTGTQCPASGDWSVSSSTKYYDETLTVNGNIKVSSDLTLTRCTVRLNCGSDGGYTINVASGASLTVYGSTITAQSSSYHYQFTVYGSMWINQSTISYMWGNTGSWTGGIQLYSDNVWIGNSSICYGETGGIYIGKCSPWIYNNNIYNNGLSSGSSSYTYGIYALGTSSTKMNITTNNIYDNTYPQYSYYYYGYGIRADYLNSNDAIYGNNIYDNGFQIYGYDNYGYELYLYHSNPTITNNDLTNGQYQLYCYYSNPPQINGGSISGDAYYYTETYGIYAYYSGLTINNVSFTSTDMEYYQYAIYASSYSPINVTDCTFSYQQYGYYQVYGIYLESYSPLQMVRCEMYIDYDGNINAIYGYNHCDIQITDSSIYNNYGYYYGIYAYYNCKVTLTGTSLYSMNAYYSYMIEAYSSSPVVLEGSRLDAQYSNYDARLVDAGDNTPVIMNNTYLNMYDCDQYMNSWQLSAIYTYSSSPVTLTNVTANFDQNSCYEWYGFYTYGNDLTINDSTIFDQPGNVRYDYFLFYLGSGDLSISNVTADLRISVPNGGGYITEMWSSSINIDRLTLTGYSNSSYFEGMYNSQGKFFMNNSNIDFLGMGQDYYMMSMYDCSVSILNSNITTETQGIQYGSMFQGDSYNGAKKFIVDNCTILVKTSNSAGANTGLGVFQEMDYMDVIITNCTVTTINTDGVAGVQAFYVYYPNSINVVDCTFHSIYGQGSSTSAPTLQWGWFYQTRLVNFTRCNITLDVKDEPMTLQSFFFDYGCGDLNFLQTNVYWNVDAAGSVVEMVSFSSDSGTGLNTLSLKQSKLQMTVSQPDCAVSILKITPDTKIGAFKVSASEVDLEYLVPTSTPTAAIQMSGSDMTISDLKLNIKAPAGTDTELIGISIASGSPTLNNITVQGNGNGHISGILVSLAATPAINGCRINNTYIGIAGDFFGMPYINKTSTENCSIGLGMQNFSNATVVDSVIKGNIAVQLIENARVNMFTSTISGSVLDWELNGNSTAWVLDCTFKPATSQNFLDGGSRLIVNWYLSLWVTWQNNVNIPGADVAMKDAQGGAFMQTVTDEQGIVPKFVVVEYVQTQASKTMSSPYVVNVTSGGVSGEQSVVTDKSKAEHIVIHDDLIPVVEILDPAVGGLQNFVTVTMIGTASDVGSGLDYMLVSYDGQNWVRQDASPAWLQLLDVPEGTWTLTAKVYDRAGNEGSATRDTTIDLTRPFIKIDSPADRSLGNVIGVDIIGSVEPGSTLTFNMRPAVVSDRGEFSYPVRLVEGRNDFALFARDRAGNENSTTLTLYLDITPPPLTLAQPRDGFLTNQSSVTVSGKTEPNATVTINGEPVNVNHDGSFSTVFGLAVGPNFLTVVATDAAGNHNTVLRNVVMDNDVRLDISSPADGLLTTQVTILVSGATDTDALLRLNGGVVSVGADGNFSVTYTLNEGRNILEFAASDRAGNSRSLTRTVRLDTISPVVEVGAPLSGAILRTGSVAVSGISEAGITLTVNGQPVDTAAGVFNATVTLPEGANRILVEGRDAAGNLVSITVPVTVDTTAPSLDIVEPSDGFRTTDRSVLIVGLTEPGSTVTVNDVPAVVDAFGKFTVQLTLVKGANAVTATSKDAAGNSATEKVTVKVVDKPASVQTGNWWWTALGLLLALGIMIPLTMYMINSWQKARMEKGGSK